MLINILPIVERFTVMKQSNQHLLKELTRYDQLCSGVNFKYQNERWHHAAQRLGLERLSPTNLLNDP